MTRLTDIAPASEVLDRARGGCAAARAELYNSLASATFGLIRRIVGSRPVAEDLFQDTMLTFFERLDSFRAEAPLGAWLRQIAISKCLMHLRSPWHRARLQLDRLDTDGAMGLALPATMPQLIFNGPAAETLDVERALATLSPTARAVVWLYEVEGYSHEEISRSFGRSVSFSKSQLARAHRRLRDWFEPRTEEQPCAPT